MKYIIAIFIGIFVGVISHSGDGYIVGGIIGYLLMQLFDLKTRIFKLENKLKNKPKQPQQQILNNYENDENKEAIKAIEGSILHDSAAFTDINTDTNTDTTDATVISRDAIVDNSQATIIETFDPQSSESQASKLQSSKPQAPKPQHSKQLKADPSTIETALAKIKSLVIGYFTGGNSLVRAGMLVLFIGVAFLLKYVAERTIVPVEYRYIGISFACLVMFVLGWKLRKKRPGFALSLEGGGIGLLYLTLFAALRLHNLLPPYVVLILLIVIVTFSALLAVSQNSMALAIIGMIGGFAAPILTSTGSGSHVQLFSYYLLLNIGIFAIAWFKSWRILNVLGFVATFGIGSLWGFQYYKPEFLFSVEPFLIAYFLLYIFIAILFALKQPPKLKGINDGTIIFGTPLVAFALQAALMQDSEYGLAYSSLALGIFYMLLAYVIKLFKKPYMQDLIESFVALGVGFVTLAIPLGFDGRVTSAMWVAEGCALLWVGARQSRLLPRFSGYALAMLGMLAFFVENKSVTGLMPWLNADYIGALIIFFAAAFIALYARSNSNKLLALEAKWIPSIMIVASAFWWVYAGILEIDRYYSNSKFILLLLFLAITSAGFMLAANKLKFKLIKTLSLIVTLMMILPFVLIPASSESLPVILNMPFMGLLVYTLTHFGMSWYWQSDKTLSSDSLPMQASNLLLLMGVIAWIFMGHHEIYIYLASEYFINASMIFMSISFIAWLLMAGKLQWQLLHLLSYAYLPYLIAMSYYILVNGYVFHDSYGLFVWLFAALVNYWMLKIYANKVMSFKGLYHLASLLLFVAIVVFEFSELVKYILGNRNIWYQASSGMMLLLLSIGLFSVRNMVAWPLSEHKKVYIQHGLLIMSAILWFMLMFINISTPNESTIINYLPILNIIDLFGIIFIIFAWKLLRNNSLSLTSGTNKIMLIALPITAFFILNTSMLRSFHFWYAIDYKFNAMVSSFLVQSAFSILWSLTAVILMVLSAKKHWRIVWLTGLGLMIAVVIKLFLVDMSASGTVERIVAFLSVGLLLSLVGYFSPLPPDTDKTKMNSLND